MCRAACAVPVASVASVRPCGLAALRLHPVPCGILCGILGIRAALRPCGGLGGLCRSLQGRRAVELVAYLAALPYKAAAYIVRLVCWLPVLNSNQPVPYLTGGGLAAALAHSKFTGN